MNFNSNINDIGQNTKVDSSSATSAAVSAPWHCERKKRRKKMGERKVVRIDKIKRSGKHSLYT